MSKDPIFRKPVFTICMRYGEAIEGIADTIEEGDRFESSLLVNFLKENPNCPSYDRIDLKDEAIREVNGRRFYSYLFANKKNPDPKDSMLIICEVFESKEKGKGLFASAQDVITVRPVSILVGENFEGILLYQMDCCSTFSYFAALQIDGLHTVNRDPVAGIQIGQERILQGLSRQADREDLELMAGLLDHALNPHHHCHGHSVPDSALHLPSGPK